MADYASFAIRFDMFHTSHSLLSLICEKLYRIEYDGLTFHLNRTN